MDIEHVWTIISGYSVEEKSHMLMTPGYIPAQRHYQHGNEVYGGLCYDFAKQYIPKTFARSCYDRRTNGIGELGISMHVLHIERLRVVMARTTY